MDGEDQRITRRKSDRLGGKLRRVVENRASCCEEKLGETESGREGAPGGGRELAGATNQHPMTEDARSGCVAADDRLVDGCDGRIEDSSMVAPLGPVQFQGLGDGPAVARDPVARDGG